MKNIYFYFIPGALIFISGLFIFFFSSYKFKFPFGYRSNLSMKNPDVWNFSNQSLGKNLMISAVISTCLGYVFLTFVVSSAGVFMVIIISALLPTIAAYMTGRKTYEYYDDNGLRIK